MEANKNAFYDQPPLQDYPGSDITNAPMPPPYTDQPPAYSTVVISSNAGYTSAPMSLDYMSKLPYGDPVNSSSQTPEMQSYHQEHLYPQMTFQQFPYQEAFNPEINNNVVSNTEPSLADTTSSTSNSFLPGSQPTSSITPHKDLLQPTPFRTVETKKTRRGNTKSHIRDLQTGKEYFIKEKVSRNGHRSKTVVVEVGGPKTIVKETPKRTIVCQKKK